MRNLTSEVLSVLVASIVFVAGPGLMTAQDQPRLPRAVERQPIQVAPVRPVPLRVEGLNDMILLDDLSGAKAVKKINLGKYWIGLNCAEVSPALRSQLKLKDGQGLLVVNAFDGSPAQKAGLKEHDVVVKAGDIEIGDVGQLVDAVQKAGESEIRIDIIREGQPQSVTVKAAERSAEQQGQYVYLPRQLGEHRLLLRTPQGVLTFIEPGVVVGPQNPPPADLLVERSLPAGVSVTITRRAGKPATIHVEQDDKTWDITSNEIGKLPKELQPHVAAMMQPVQARVFNPQWTGWLQNRLGRPFSLPEEQPLGLPPAVPDAVGSAAPDAAPRKVESEIERLKRELSEEMKQLRKAIDELKKSNEAE